MSERTSRDLAWRAVLEHLDQHGRVRSSELDLPDSQTRTAVRVLRSMEDMGLLERDSPDAHTWYPTDRLAGVCTGIAGQQRQQD